MSNVFTGLAPGLYDVYIADAMVPFCYIHLTITVSNSFIDGIATGIYRLYPVPVDEKVTIELTGNNTAGAVSTVCSLQGKELLVTNLTEVKTVLETTSLQPGVYLLKVCIEGKYFMSKFVKL